MKEQELNHICKFCKKNFPSGRSLGGHIRCHLPKSGYKLREMPKKKSKLADHNLLLTTSTSSWSIESKTEDNIRSSFIGNNPNSSISEVVDTEQEEVAIAICLMMLSRDVGHRGDNSSSFSVELSDNISMLQPNSSRRRRRKGEKIQEKEYVSCGTDDTSNERDNLVFLESGYLQNGSKIKEFEVFTDGFDSIDQNNKSLESKKRVEKIQGNVSVSGVTDKKSKKVESIASGNVKNESKMKEFEVFTNGLISNDQNSKPSKSKRKADDLNHNNNLKKFETAISGYVKNEGNMQEFEFSGNGFQSNDQKNKYHIDHESGFDENGMDSKLCYDNKDNKRSKFECTTCNKVFHSYQALGGHKASHKKFVGIKDSSVFNDHNQQQQVLVHEIGIGSSPKKIIQRHHECSICSRVFPSGQALGGHKRSHLLADDDNNNNNGNRNSEGQNNQSSSIINEVKKSSRPEIKELLDLNLPPGSVEEVTTTITSTSSSSNSLVGFIKPYWCVESSHKHEPLLG